MPNVTAGYSLPSAGTPSQVQIIWTVNGSPAATVNVPVVSGQTAYSVDFNSGNPGVTLNGGDVVGCTGQAQDIPNSEMGPVDTPTPATVTIPAGPPPPPGDLVNFTLTVNP